MEKINIAELLKDCPTGMELDCTMYEDVYFDYVDELNIIHCYIQRGTHKTSLTFNYNGTPNCDTKSKCVIFPKGKTAWEGFQRPFVEGDIVTWQDRGSLVACIYKERKNTTSFYHHIALYNGGIGIILDGEIVLTDDELCFATEEEKTKLFDAIKANGYKWNAESKTLEKLVEPKFKIGDRVRNKNYKDYIYYIHDITDKGYRTKEINADSPIISLFGSQEDNYELVPNKFDITTLIPFESKVLVRDNVDEVWLPCFFGGISDNNDYPYRIVGGEIWKYCIPYEGNEHLLNKKEDCDEYFKNW